MLSKCCQSAAKTLPKIGQKSIKNMFNSCFKTLNKKRHMRQNKEKCKDRRT